MTQRLVRHPYLALFDGPDTNLSTDVRTTATVPLQARKVVPPRAVMSNSFAFGGTNAVLVARSKP